MVNLPQPWPRVVAVRAKSALLSVRALRRYFAA